MKFSIFVRSHIILYTRKTTRFTFTLFKYQERKSRAVTKQPISDNIKIYDNNIKVCVAVAKYEPTLKSDRGRIMFQEIQSNFGWIEWQLHLVTNISVFLFQYGQIHVIARALVVEKFGEEAWSKILWVPVKVHTYVD